MPLRKKDERYGPDGKLLFFKKEVDKKRRPPKGLDKDTTTSAYGDAGRGRPVPKFKDKDDKKEQAKPVSGFKEGGVCRGAGAAVKGTKFEGVF